jgi:hypothetical protein
VFVDLPGAGGIRMAGNLPGDAEQEVEIGAETHLMACWSLTRSIDPTEAG